MALIPNNVVVIDTASQRVRKDGEEIVLTRAEYRLLEYLTVNRWRILPVEMILDQVWGYETDLEHGPHLVQVNICRLRKKLGDDQKRIIQTRRGLGYMIENLVVIRAFSEWDDYERLV